MIQAMIQKYSYCLCCGFISIPKLSFWFKNQLNYRGYKGYWGYKLTGQGFQGVTFLENTKVTDFWGYISMSILSVYIW